MSVEELEHGKKSTSGPGSKAAPKSPSSPPKCKTRLRPPDAMSGKEGIGLTNNQRPWQTDRTSLQSCSARPMPSLRRRNQADREQAERCRDRKISFS